jgi:hypothetical protein
VREICMLRSTRRGLETWHGRDGVTLADERARQRGTQTSTYTGAPVLDPTWERAELKFLRAIRPDPASLAYPFCPLFSASGPRSQRDGLKAR